MTSEAPSGMENARKALRIGRLAILLTGVLASTGCAGGAAPEETTPTTSPPAPTSNAPAPAPSEKPQSIALPDCETMNATIAGESDAFYELQGEAGVTAHRGAVDLSIFDDTVGPSAQEAMTRATQVAGCTWPVHYHNIVTQYVAQIPAETGEWLIAELRGSVYVESTTGPAIRFDHTEPSDSPFTVATDITYLFFDDVWIAIVGNGSLDYAQAALDGLAAANPGLL